MSKTKSQEPGAVLLSFIGKYQLNPSRLGAAISLSQSTIRQITLSKMKITVPVALRLAKFFGNSVDFWLKTQLEYDLEKAEGDKKLASILKSIEKVKKPRPSDIEKIEKAKKVRKARKARADAKKRTAS